MQGNSRLCAGSFLRGSPRLFVGGAGAPQGPQACRGPPAAPGKQTNLCPSSSSFSARKQRPGATERRKKKPLIPGQTQVSSVAGRGQETFPKADRKHKAESGLCGTEKQECMESPPSEAQTHGVRRGLGTTENPAFDHPAHVMSNGCLFLRERQKLCPAQASGKGREEKPAPSTLQAEAAQRISRPAVHRRRRLKTKRNSNPARVLTRLTTPLPLAA